MIYELVVGTQSNRLGPGHGHVDAWGRQARRGNSHSDSGHERASLSAPIRVLLMSILVWIGELTDVRKPFDTLESRDAPNKARMRGAFLWALAIALFMQIYLNLNSNEW